MSLYVKGLVTLYSRITKLGWFDNEKDEFVFRNVMSDVNKFLSGTVLFGFVVGLKKVSKWGQKKP